MPLYNKAIHMRPDYTEYSIHHGRIIQYVHVDFKTRKFRILATN